MLQLEKPAVHFAEPLTVYKKHPRVHAYAACACILVLSTVYAIVTSWNYQILQFSKSASLTVSFHIAD